MTDQQLPAPYTLVEITGGQHHGCSGFVADPAEAGGYGDTRVRVGVEDVGVVGVLLSNIKVVSPNAPVHVQQPRTKPEAAPEPIDDREEFQVAVSVFVTARGVDQIDAQHGAEIAVRHALRTVEVEPGVLETPHRRVGSFRVRVHKVMDTTTAGINGYLATKPTNRAYREGA